MAQESGCALIEEINVQFTLGRRDRRERRGVAREYRVIRHRTSPCLILYTKSNDTVS